MDKPKGFEQDLGEYDVCFYDSWCGEPVAWGFPIINRLGEQRWNDLGKFGGLECANMSYPPKWYLIIKRLTREEAIKKYGPVIDEVYGPRGGWKSVTFGDKKFCCRDLREN